MKTPGPGTNHNYPVVSHNHFGERACFDTDLVYPSEKDTLEFMDLNLQLA